MIYIKVIIGVLRSEIGSIYVDVVEWSRALDVRLSEWCGFKSRRGKYKNLTALKSNSNTVWVNFQTYIDIYIYSNNVFYCKLYDPLQRNKNTF